MLQHSQHSNESQHSRNDITIENARISVDGNSKEKYDLEVTVIETSIENSDDYHHPDGGLTAWLVVVGVCLLFFLSDQTILCFFFVGDV